MTPSVAKKIKSFYDRFKEDDAVLVLINADPDAIASAMAVKQLLQQHVDRVTLSHINVIERPDNIAMVNLLNAGLVHVDRIKPKRFSRFVILDSQPSHNEIFGNFTFDAVIDHHPDGGNSNLSPKAFRDIRPEYGATSTIMIEYLKAASIEPSYKLATALYLGIKTDTSDFERNALVEDVRAFQFIYQYTNTHLARRIEQAELKPEFLKYISRALTRKTIRKNKIIAHIGYVENPDICVIIADFFMRIHSMKWSIVSGIYDKKLIVVLRNDGVSRDAGKTAKKIFDQIGSAGGHKSMARAELPMDVFARETGKKTGKDIQAWLVQQFTPH
ncbi:MAG: DHH family phosphoesterase [Thermodesulfobacteriota bacterium]|nr:DHH family phosphoesterase [Thermodesulfobacteriota bacterium]